MYMSACNTLIFLLCIMSLLCSHFFLSLSSTSCSCCILIWYELYFFSNLTYVHSITHAYTHTHTRTLSLSLIHSIFIYSKVLPSISRNISCSNAYRVKVLRSCTLSPSSQDSIPALWCLQFLFPYPRGLCFCASFRTGHGLCFCPSLRTGHGLCFCA